MPKRSRTRIDRARELRARLTRGPSWGTTFWRELSPEQRPAVDAYLAREWRSWTETWILGELGELVPELRKETTPATCPKCGAAAGSEYATTTCGYFHTSNSCPMRRSTI